MSIDTANSILNQFHSFNFNLYQLDQNNYKLILEDYIDNHEKLFIELQNITNFLVELNVDFLVGVDGSIIIQ